MPTKKKYALRYLIQPWGKPADKTGATKVCAGVTVSGDDYGYADRLFVASIVGNSVLLLDSQDGPNISREMIDEMIGHLEHFRDHHLPSQERS